MPEVLDRTVIAVPLLSQLTNEAEIAVEEAAPTPTVYPVIIDLNLSFHGGPDGAKERAKELIDRAISSKATHATDDQGVNRPKSDLSQQYLFASLQAEVIRELVRLDNQQSGQIASSSQRAIFRIWPDFPVKRMIHESVSTVKADAAKAAFAASGDGIVWAVVDSGIEAAHPHFLKHKNLEVPAPMEHQDFSGLKDQPLVDEFGHGTHVAGIIGGELAATAEKPIRAFARHRDENGEVTYNEVTLTSMAGMAPKCKLLSLKVLNAQGGGLASNLIAAIAYIQKVNGYGRNIRIHGVNMSVGYDFEPEWFACGQSPLCVEVNQLVRSGVVVVVAAGNTGYGWFQSQSLGTVAVGMDLTINDPGNAEEAITVGSTHRVAPHVYGVSYFSSKGPTGDGRLKPDLVAPGEKILSCAAGTRLEEARDRAGECDYLEDSGTSMAAPHVSGVIASFLSIRGEFKGRAQEVKQVFVSTATDLKRERSFQGNGLVDLMRAIQSV